MRTEIAIIGSGPGGAITAALLAEAGRSVTLIEEGDRFESGSPEPFSIDEMTHKYRDGGVTPAFGKTKIAYVEGRCVGGGSEINSGLYHRTPDEILDRWRTEFDVKGLEGLTPHFEACEKELSVSRMTGQPPAASMKLAEGASLLGWRADEIPRWHRYENASDKTGLRQTMSRTYIPRAIHAGCNLLSGTRARSIRMENGRWNIAASQGRKLNQIEADVLFLCAGAIQTPALLRRSGIRTNIGNTLQLHPTVKVAARFSEPVQSMNTGVPVHQVKQFAPGMSFGCSISSPPHLALSLARYPNHLSNRLQQWEHMAVYYAMIATVSVGTIRSLPGFQSPLVRYSLTGGDHEKLALGVGRLCEMLLAAGAVELFPSYANSEPFRNQNDIKKIPQRLPAGDSDFMTIHLFSSCPMGEKRSVCAASSFGLVHGFKNLHISDASLLCTAPTVNPQGSVMALARRNALAFLNKF